MLPSVGPQGAQGPGEPPGPFSKPGVLLPGPQAPGISSAVAGRGLGTREVAWGPPGRLTLVWMSVQFCQQSVQGLRGAEQGGHAGGHRPEVARKSSLLAEGHLPPPLPPKSPHSPVTKPPFPEATSPGPVPLPTAMRKGMETSAEVGGPAGQGWGRGVEEGKGRGRQRELAAQRAGEGPGRSSSTASPPAALPWIWRGAGQGAAANAGGLGGS